MPRSVLSLVALAVGPVQAQLGSTWFNPTQGYQAGTITLSPSYTLSFEIHPTQRRGGWNSVVHVGASNSVRLPGIWFHSNRFSLHICYDPTHGEGQVCIDTRELSDSEPTFVSIMVDSATRTMTAYMNGESWGSRSYRTSHATGTHPLWISDPWYSAGNTLIRNVRLTDGIVSAAGDPHLALPHGGKADFRGEHKAIYNFFTAKNVALNVMTELADFELHDANDTRHKDVHGSFITQAHVVARTNTGKMVRVSFWADMIKEKYNGDGYAMNLGWANGTVDSEPVFILQPPHRREKQVDDIKLRMDYSSLHVLTPEVEIVITPMHFRLERNVVGLHHRLDLKIKPRVAEAAFAVPPHGIIGQGWDGDDKAIDGEQDAWPAAGEFTTYAMAKGAIEGVPNDYKVASPYATDFKYSRFDMASAEPRNVTRLVAAGQLNVPKTVYGGDVVGSTEITEEVM